MIPKQPVASIFSRLRRVEAKAAAGSSGGVSNGDKGSLTVSGNTWTINTGAVTNDMLAGSINLTKLATDPLARANHTGTQPHTTISGLGTLATQSATITDYLTISAAASTYVASSTLASWTGSNTITTLGTVTTGTWNATNIAPAKLGTGTSIDTKYLRGDGTWQTLPSTSDVVYVGPSADTSIASLTDVTIVTTDVSSVAAGDQMIVEGHFTILNNSTATRVYVVTLDFDGLFDIEFTTGALAFSTTLLHPFYVRGILDVRSSSLSYSVQTIEGQLATGVASGGDTTMAATHLRAMGWGTSSSDATGTVTVTLRIRSASNIATQTCRLHQFSIRKMR